MCAKVHVIKHSEKQRMKSKQSQRDRKLVAKSSKSTLMSILDFTNVLLKCSAGFASWYFHNDKSKKDLR